MTGKMKTAFQPIAAKQKVFTVIILCIEKREKAIIKPDSALTLV